LQTAGWLPRLPSTELLRFETWDGRPAAAWDDLRRAAQASEGPGTEREGIKPARPGWARCTAPRETAYGVSQPGAVFPGNPHVGPGQRAALVGVGGTGHPGRKCGVQPRRESGGHRGHRKELPAGACKGSLAAGGARQHLGGRRRAGEPMRNANRSPDLASPTREKKVSVLACLRPGA